MIQFSRGLFGLICFLMGEGLSLWRVLWYTFEKLTFPRIARGRYGGIPAGSEEVRNVLERKEKNGAADDAAGRAGGAAG